MLKMAAICQHGDVICLISIMLNSKLPLRTKVRPPSPLCLRPSSRLQVWIMHLAPLIRNSFFGQISDQWLRKAPGIEPVDFVFKLDHAGFRVDIGQHSQSNRHLTQILGWNALTSLNAYLLAYMPTFCFWKSHSQSMIIIINENASEKLQVGNNVKLVTVRGGKLCIDSTNFDRPKSNIIIAESYLRTSSLKTAYRVWRDEQTAVFDGAVNLKNRRFLTMDFSTGMSNEPNPIRFSIQN